MGSAGAGATVPEPCGFWPRRSFRRAGGVRRVIALLVFAGTLLAAVLLSGLAERTVLSTAVLFLLTGFLVGGGMLDLLALQPSDPLVVHLAEVAVFGVLFTDGMRAGARDLASAGTSRGGHSSWGYR